MLYIKDKLKKLGMTQDDLAREMGCNRNTIYTIIGNNPQLDSIRKMERILKCQPSDLLYRAQKGTFACPYCGEEIEWEVIDERPKIVYRNSILYKTYIKKGYSHVGKGKKNSPEE